MNIDTTTRDRLSLGDYRHTLYTSGADHRACAEHYEAMQHTPDAYSTEVSYVHFKHQTMAQYADLLSSGLAVEYHDGEHDYPNSAAMLADLNNDHLWTLRTDPKGHGLPQDHPMLEIAAYEKDEDGYGQSLLLNDIFRAVHDALGHGGAHSSFSLNGEFEAWGAHRTHYSYDALPALWCETRGQSAWTNCYGDNGLLPLKDRPYADQKAGHPGHLYI